MCFKRVSPHKIGCFFVTAVNNINQNRMNWRGTNVLDFHFVARWQAAPRPKRWFIHLSNLLFPPRWFLPLQTPSLPGDTPDGGQKSIYTFIYWNQLPSFSYFLLPDYCPSWPFHCEMIAGQRPKIALLQCFAGNVSLAIKHLHKCGSTYIISIFQIKYVISIFMNKKSKQTSWNHLVNASVCLEYLKASFQKFKKR